MKLAVKEILIQRTLHYRYVQNNYRIAGYFRGANISRLAVLVNFAENIFMYHCSATMGML